MQKVLFPMQYLRVTQGYGVNSDGSVDYNSYSHTGSYALDLGGKSGNENDYVFAPCDVKVVRHYRGSGYNAVWFESLDLAKCADGENRKLIFLMIHAEDSTISELGITLGKIFKQGEKIYREGSGGGVAAHLHLEAGQAHFTGSGWYQSQYTDKLGNKVWIINNPLPLHQVFFIPQTTAILNDGGYIWKNEEEFKPMRLKIGYASSGDLKTLKSILDEKLISYKEENGYLITDVAVSGGDYTVIKNKCDELGIGCEEYKDEETGPTPEQDGSSETFNCPFAQEYAQLKSEKEQLITENTSLKTENEQLKEKISSAVQALQ